MRRHITGLDNLVVMVDNNRMQADGATADVMGVEPVPEKLEAFGFAARRLDANSIDGGARRVRLGEGAAWRPAGLVCDNVPGKGVPSFEVYEKVHYIRAADEVWAARARGARIVGAGRAPESREPQLLGEPPGEARVIDDHARTAAPRATGIAGAVGAPPEGSRRSAEDRTAVATGDDRVALDLEPLEGVLHVHCAKGRLRHRPARRIRHT